ncbi:MULTISPECIES: hemerythrin domain-containing protein [unclassified Staphylococcus]|uniref:hemerythrin domain-containing protein n=1 Tax=unclassified Staphylococcus TaxID=91994 RepID=UPI001AEC1D59|nr:MULTISPECIES: hemerythrin domain-containing protein [unclassified Staphylococcus]
MAGPSLRKADSHNSIHEASLSEARELTEILSKVINQKHKALEVAYVLLEHWEARVLAHADVEEKGLYPELAGDEPSQIKIMHRLQRDHDLLRKLSEQIKVSLKNDEVDHEVLVKFYTMIEVDDLHNEDEESWVASKEKG